MFDSHSCFVVKSNALVYNIFISNINAFVEYLCIHFNFSSEVINCQSSDKRKIRLLIFVTVLFSENDENRENMYYKLMILFTTVGRCFTFFVN